MTTIPTLYFNHTFADEHAWKTFTVSRPSVDGDAVTFTYHATQPLAAGKWQSEVGRIVVDTAQEGAGIRVTGYHFGEVMTTTHFP